MDELVYVFTVCICSVVGIYFSCKYEPNSAIDLFYEDALVDCWKHIGKYTYSYDNLVFCVLILFYHNETMSVMWYAIG